jgi:steroid 5-alpha reductase family enzyme
MTIADALLLNAGLIAVTMIALWLISVIRKDASIVDIFWGLGFGLIAGATFAVSPGGAKPIALTCLTVVWGLRLSGYIAWRNHGKGEDPRYQAMRAYRGASFWWISLFTVFGLQGAVMWLVSLPVQVGQLQGPTLSAVSYLGIAVGAVGFLFESLGDFQLAKFKSNSKNRNQVMDQGLWRYTRHPNYFGNALVWWGVFLVAVTPSTFWLAISPVVMTFLLVKVSGVALLEKSLGSRSPEYRDYMRRTSAFIPWPPKSSGP